ncbi:hypothetical protein BU24DRAFT_425527 [Aaosphaeria arxii CBS 175.79]|uniref:Uncharacterized protein n=1 Tax=Aaosphaeria arxii CBS 175.79 TaxID=1450172 RepID=A0A6A5XI37_9PLEO|nr:uncharacterized protein BU24DRAFT_425527 [Aaosphaeria arxii CBS 175.79]KAF2012925.1 hypothetical protein BU24DRAFT_425527 [Aaosphaeria arxii CBS 175.79]
MVAVSSFSSGVAVYVRLWSLPAQCTCLVPPLIAAIMLAITHQHRRPHGAICNASVADPPCSLPYSRYEDSVPAKLCSGERLTCHVKFGSAS